MNTTRYWYHVSDSLHRKRHRLTPRKEGANRCDEEPKIARVCVAPSIEQCLTAIPYSPYSRLAVYRTLRKVTAKKSVGIIDSNITKEHWITKKVNYVRVGLLNLEEFRHPSECATNCDNAKKVKKTLKAWRDKKLIKSYLIEK